MDVAKVTDLEPITKLSNLEMLFLGGDLIQEIEMLKDLTNLKTLGLSNCYKLEKSQKENLKKALPNLEIFEMDRE